MHRLDQRNIRVCATVLADAHLGGPRRCTITTWSTDGYFVRDRVQLRISVGR